MTPLKRAVQHTKLNDMEYRNATEVAREITESRHDDLDELRASICDGK
jgi:hypothetical protein